MDTQQVKNRPQTLRLLDKIKQHPVQTTRWYAQLVGRPAPSVRRDLTLLYAAGLVDKTVANDGAPAWVVPS